MPGDQQEPNRVMGIPWTRDPQGRWDYEPKHVMGFPVDWSGEIDLDWVRSLAHPVGSTGDGCGGAAWARTPSTRTNSGETAEHY